MALRTERALLRAVCAQQRHCERGGAERLQGAEQGRNTGRDREATGRKAAKKQKQGKADGDGAFAGALEKAPVFEEGGLLLAGRYGGQDYFFKGEHADGALEVRAENDGTAARAASPGEPGVRCGSLPETEGGGNA